MNHAIQSRMAQLKRIGAVIGWMGLLASFAGCSGGTTGGGGPADGCEYAGKRYAVGDSFPDQDGCNQCACSEGGEVSCTLKACLPDEACSYSGKVYAVGDTFPDEDGCNQCACSEGGEVSCTTKACLPDEACSYSGKVYTVGDTFASSDGCNACFCAEGGLVSCTVKHCGDDSCQRIDAEREKELARVQACSVAADCGQPITGSSCGCTRNLVARKDADLTDYLKLQQLAAEACDVGGSTCDCPEADGFACVNERCTWNYTTEKPEPQCTKHEAGRLCVRGTPTADGEVLSVGDTLSITVGVQGCFSSSCSKVHKAECSISENSGFDVSATFCVSDTSEQVQACTDDCGNVHADCSFGQPLSEGAHELRLGSVVVGFQVPGTLPRGGLCAGSQF